METVLEIDLKKIKNNIKLLNKSYNDYKYKYVDLIDNAHGLGFEIVNTLYNNGIYSCIVETVKDALIIRKINKDINILVTSYYTEDEIYDSLNNNITLTIHKKEEIDLINSLNIKDDLNIELLIANSSIIEGLSNIDEIVGLINSNKHIKLRGMYSKLTSYGIVDEYYYHQVNEIYKVIKDTNLNNIIVHLNEPLMYHQKLDFINGINFDLSLIGIEENIKDDFFTKQLIKKVEKKYKDAEFPNIDLELVFNITSYISNKKYLKKGTLVGNNFILKKDAYVGIVPIGHKDGITKAIKYVGINGFKRYILADDIDRLYVLIDDVTNIGDKVYILNEERGIYDFLTNINSNRYYLMSILNKNLKKVYLNKETNKDNLL